MPNIPTRGLTDSGTRRFRAPEVSVRAEGASGYTVVLYGIDGTPVELRRFTLNESDRPNASALAASQARAYRDGVAEGIFRASRMLSEVIGYGS